MFDVWKFRRDLDAHPHDCVFKSQRSPYPLRMELQIALGYGRALRLLPNTCGWRINLGPSSESGYGAWSPITLYNVLTLLPHDHWEKAWSEHKHKLIELRGRVEWALEEREPSEWVILGQQQEQIDALRDYWRMSKEQASAKQLYENYAPVA